MANRFQVTNQLLGASLTTSTVIAHGLTLNGVGGAAGVVPTEVSAIPRVTHTNAPWFLLAISTIDATNIRVRAVADTISTVNTRGATVRRAAIVAAVPHTYIR